jgi:dephospho-CoA kinase
VTVEGNIGSGKSTFLQYFKNFPEVDVSIVSGGQYLGGFLHHEIQNKSHL